MGTRINIFRRWQQIRKMLPAPEDFIRVAIIFSNRFDFFACCLLPATKNDFFVKFLRVATF